MVRDKTRRGGKGWSGTAWWAVLRLLDFIIRAVGASDCYSRIGSWWYVILERCFWQYGGSWLAMKTRDSGLGQAGSGSGYGSDDRSGTKWIFLWKITLTDLIGVCVCVLGEGALSEEEGRVENNTHVSGFMLWWWRGTGGWGKRMVSYVWDTSILKSLWDSWV